MVSGKEHLIPARGLAAIGMLVGAFMESLGRILIGVDLNV
jgi:hypothetical protein